MKQTMSYKFRIYPTKEQEEQLFKTIGCARLMYNLFLDSYSKLYADYKNGILTEKDYKEARKSLLVSTSKKEKSYAFLKEVDRIDLDYWHKHITTPIRTHFDRS